MSNDIAIFLNVTFRGLGCHVVGSGLSRSFGGGVVPPSSPSDESKYIDYADTGVISPCRHHKAVDHNE